MPQNSDGVLAMSFRARPLLFGLQGFLLGPWLFGLGDKKQAVLDEVMALLADKIIEPLSGEQCLSGTYHKTHSHEFSGSESSSRLFIRQTSFSSDTKQECFFQPVHVSRLAAPGPLQPHQLCSTRMT